MDSLPSELIREILLLTFSRTEPLSTRSSLLCSYSLVSPPWRLLAQGELFVAPSLSSSTATDAFLRAVTKEPELGRLVRRLKLAGVDGCFDRTARLKALLEACEELVELRLEHASVVCDHLHHPREPLLRRARTPLTQRLQTSAPSSSDRKSVV